MTLYVESNFVLEIVLGQEDLAAAERLLAAAEHQAILLVLPALSLSEPLSRVSGAARDRDRLMNQFRSHLSQISRSALHRRELQDLQAVPGHIEAIGLREQQRLTMTIERVLATARLIALTPSVFASALDVQSRFTLPIEDAIVLASVLADLKSAAPSRNRHIFANRNRKDFDNSFIAGELHRLNCDLEFSFSETARRLGI